MASHSRKRNAQELSEKVCARARRGYAKRTNIPYVLAEHQLAFLFGEGKVTGLSPNLTFRRMFPLVSHKAIETKCPAVWGKPVLSPALYLKGWMHQIENTRLATILRGNYGKMPQSLMY